MSLKFKQHIYILSLSNSSIGDIECLRVLLLVQVHIGGSRGNFKTQVYFVVITTHEGIDSQYFLSVLTGFVSLKFCFHLLILKLFEPELFICLNMKQAKAIRSSSIHPKLTKACICATARILVAQIPDYTPPKSAMAGVQFSPSQGSVAPVALPYATQHIKPPDQPVSVL